MRASILRPPLFPTMVKSGLASAISFWETRIGSKPGLPQRKNVCRFLNLPSSLRLIPFLPVADNQYNEIINAPDAWSISEDVESHNLSRDVKPSVSSRRIKAIIEQVTGSYRDFILMCSLIKHCS